MGSTGFDFSPEFYFSFMVLLLIFLPSFSCIFFCDERQSRFSFSLFWGVFVDFRSRLMQYEVVFP